MLKSAMKSVLSLLSSIQPLSGYLQLSPAGEGILGTQITWEISFSLHLFPIPAQSPQATFIMDLGCLKNIFYKSDNAPRIFKGILLPPVDSFIFHPPFDTVNFRNLRILISSILQSNLKMLKIMLTMNRTGIYCLLHLSPFVHYTQLFLLFLH